MALAAVPVLIVAVSRDAGPFAGALIPSFLLLLLAMPLVVVAIVVRPFLRPEGRSGRWLLASLTFLAVAVAAVPVGERVHVGMANRRVDRLVSRVDADGRACARKAVQAVPEEVETNPGVEIRPRLTSAARRCIERSRERLRLVCNLHSCTGSLRGLEDGDAEGFVVDLRGWLAAELQRAGRLAYDRSQPSAEYPPGVALHYYGE